MGIHATSTLSFKYGYLWLQKNKMATAKTPNSRLKMGVDKPMMLPWQHPLSYSVYVFDSSRTCSHPVCSAMCLHALQDKSVSQA